MVVFFFKSEKKTKFEKSVILIIFIKEFLSKFPSKHSDLFLNRNG